MQRDRNQRQRDLVWGLESFSWLSFWILGVFYSQTILGLGKMWGGNTDTLLITQKAEVKVIYPCWTGWLLQLTAASVCLSRVCNLVWVNLWNKYAAFICTRVQARVLPLTGADPHVYIKMQSKSWIRLLPLLISSVVLLNFVTADRTSWLLRASLRTPLSPQMFCIYFKVVGFGFFFYCWEKDNKI